MKKQNSNTKIISTLVLFFLISYTVIAQIPKTNYEHIKQAKYDLTMKNYLRNLQSENHGVRISAVEIVGRYKISDLEDELIEMLNEEENETDKEVIALSLFQLGSFNSISTIKKSLQNSDDEVYKNFIKNLLTKYNEYDKLRSEYFNDLVANIFETR